MPISPNEDGVVSLRPNSFVLRPFFPSPAAVNEFSDPSIPPSCSDLEEPIPDDRYHGIYFAMLLAGVGFLLPYNSFITDVDYLHDKFKGSGLIKHSHSHARGPFPVRSA